MKRLLVPVLVVAGIAAVMLATGGAATASSGAEVDFGDCAFNNNGVATAPADTPITVTDTGGSATGNYGTALHGWKTGVNTATIAVTGGTTTTIPLVSSFPQYFGDPYFAWLTILQDIPLDPLSSGGSVLVTIDSTNTAAGEAVFPGQGYPAPHFGPFHVSKGDTFEAQCLITADS